MERGSGQEVNNFQEGTAVGVWIIRKSKTYPGHNYYFNTLTGAAVWNLSEQEIANAMRMPNINRFDNHAEPKEKPPMMNFNPASEFSHSTANKKYPSEAFPISTWVCPQSAIHNSQGSIKSGNLMTTQPKSNPNIWDLGLRQQIVILPTVTPLNHPQLLSYGYNLHQSNNFQQRNDLQQRNGLPQRNVWQESNDFQLRHNLQDGSNFQSKNGLQLTNGLQPTKGLQPTNGLQPTTGLQQINDLQQRHDLQQINYMQQRNDLQQINYLQQGNDLQQINDLQQQNDLQHSNDLEQRNNKWSRRDMIKNTGKVYRFGLNRGRNFQNRYHKTWSKQDLRKKIYKHVNYSKNYLNTSRLSSNEGFINDPKFKQTGTIENEENYETASLIENEKHSVSKLDCTPLKNLGKPTVHKNCWYLLVDTNVLIHNFNYLNNLTSTDPTCCFLVPHCVFDELKSYAEERQDATAGRVLRFLFDYACIGIEELEIESEYESTTDVLRKVYNVYVNIEKDNYHAVLISDDKNLLKYKGVIQVFSMVEVKNMVSVYVSHQTLSAPSSSISDRVVIINKNNDLHTTMDKNHTVSNRKRSFSESQKEQDNLRIVSSPSKSIKTHISTELMKKKCVLKSFNDISITIVNTDNRTNKIESADEVAIEQNRINDTTKTSTLNEECTPSMIEKKNVIRLNRNKLPPYNNNTIETPVVGIEKKKFRWRKRRNTFKGSEDNIVSSIDNNERRVGNTESLECGRETSQNTSKNTSEENKSKDLDTNESSESCIAFKNSSNYSESLGIRNDMIENEVSNTDKEKQLKDLECDNSSNSCTFVKKFTKDCIVIDDSSTSEIISNSESNFNSTHVLNIQKTPKLFRRLKKNSNKNLLNNTVFTVTSKAMEENIKMKCDEWVSRFVQIMEDVLAQILRQESVIERIALPPPWSLQEAVQCIIKEFYSHCFVVDAANKLSIISKEIEKTKSITDILPEEFMEMYSYGVNLVDALKDVQPNEDLNIASKSLSDLLHDIEFGQNDSFVDEVPEDKGEATLIPDVPLKDIVHSVSGIKIPNNNNPEECADHSRKSISVDRNNSSPVKKLKEDVMVTFIAELSESNTTDAEIDHKVTNAGRLTPENNNCDEVDGSIGNKNVDSIIEPKIVRCFTKFPEFEERINSSHRPLMSIYSTDSDIFYEDDNYEATNCSMGDEDITDLYETPNTCTYFANVQKDKTQVELYLNKFVNNIKNVLTRVTEFCKSCVLYVNKQGSTTVDIGLQLKVEKFHSEVISIYYKLNSILSRENGEENINNLYGCDYEFSEQYRNTVKKCREQTSTILKIVEHITMALKR